MASDMRARPISAKYLRPSSRAPMDSVTAAESSVDSPSARESGKSAIHVVDGTRCVYRITCSSVCAECSLGSLVTPSPNTRTTYNLVSRPFHADVFLFPWRTIKEKAWKHLSCIM